MLFLKRVALREAEPASGSEDPSFPMSLKILVDLELRLETPVTFLVGENGSGKSTLLEAIAVACGAIALGSSDLEQDPSLEHARQLASRLRIGRGSKARTTMFFRAEDAFGYTKRLQTEMQALEVMEEDFREEFEEGSLGQKLAMGTANSQRHALKKRYGENPDAASHGETFLHLLEQRLVPKGLYILDEPETPLSPLRILTLIRLFHTCVSNGCQFLVATHSPLLMAFPGAKIFELSETGITTVKWQDVEHVQLTRSFLAEPKRYLKELLKD